MATKMPLMAGERDPPSPHFINWEHAPKINCVSLYAVKVGVMVFTLIFLLWPVCYGLTWGSNHYDTLTGSRDATVHVMRYHTPVNDKGCCIPRIEFCVDEQKPCIWVDLMRVCDGTPEGVRANLRSMYPINSTSHAYAAEDYVALSKSDWNWRVASVEGALVGCSFALLAIIGLLGWTAWKVWRTYRANKATL